MYIEMRLVRDMWSSSWILLSILLLFFANMSGVTGGAAKDRKLAVLNVGVIVRPNSFVGKEVRAAVEIACRDLNAASRGYAAVKPHYKCSSTPLEAVSAAEELIKRKKVRVIIGLETWEEAVLVTGIGAQHRVPVISFARNYNRFAPSAVLPGLIHVGINESEQIQCVADIVRSYNRRRVSLIYEESSTLSENDSGSSIYTLSESLRRVGSEIEQQLALPGLSSSSDREVDVVRDKLMKLRETLSPVVIVLDLSVEMTRHLLKEARKMGFLKGEDQTIWIFSETMLNQLNSIGSRVTSSSMKGALGVMTYHPRRKNKSYSVFRRKFKREPSVIALRAYDCITLIAEEAMDGLTGGGEVTSEILGKRILQGSEVHHGLSGEIQFEGGRLLNPSRLAVVSIEGGNKEPYKELKLWSQGRFSDVPVVLELAPMAQFRPASSSDDASTTNKILTIGVPNSTFFDMFVKEEPDGKYTGFCIEVFYQILNITNLAGTLKYKFVWHDGSYDELVEKVKNKTYDAAVGDITILAKRAEQVDFTQPFIESGLSMIVVAEPDRKSALIFTQPFTMNMWIASCGVLLLTILVVWFLEHPFNPEFSGSWPDQIGTASWFTFSSLFFAHRETISHNLTRTVVIVWFFVALILTQSYTANLTAMLTVRRLKPDVVTMEELKQTNARVGCDTNTFLCNYLEQVHHFNDTNIDHLTIDYPDYEKELKSGRIKALFLEYPYERAFFSRYCNGYTVARQSYRFGGFGFVFPNGSNLTAIFSDAILALSEDGTLRRLEDEAFGSRCTSAGNTEAASSETQSLGLDSFWALYVLSLAIYFVCMVSSSFCSRRTTTDPAHGQGNYDNAANQEMDEVNRHG